jgi:glycine/D-amino acid oxidase-like deaminating enzyme/nitrite reductase/ring-hydroxylating ferredoxin subunit
MKTASHWIESAPLPRFPQIERNLTVDVVVVGAGITGVTAAYLFKKEGYRVALLERGRCGGADTSSTTAHLTCVTDVRLHRLVRRFGKDHARAVWDAGLASLDQIFANTRSEDIHCDFHWIPGYLHASPEESAGRARTGLKQDARLAREMGFDTQFLEETPYFGAPGVKHPHQARFHPLKYLAGLLARLPGRGAYVFEQTEATEFSTTPLSVTANRSWRIGCAYVVIATHNPLMGNTGLLSSTFLQTRLYPYTSYVLSAKVPKALIPDALFWDTSEPYYYLRLDPRRGFDQLIFGGEDHKTGQCSDTESVFRRLNRTLSQRIPEAIPTRGWSGQVIETNDGLPFMGETAERQFVITGCSGNGMTLGTLGAMMAVDTLEQRANPWTELFNPHRKKIRGGTWNYLKENRDYPYYLIRDWLGRSEGRNLRALKRNEGKILTLNGRKVAAFRNEQGQVTLRSPVCTHLKCIVAWNNSEKTWDCPCHGSRFSATGEVLAGPAEQDLAGIADQPQVETLRPS